MRSFTRTHSCLDLLNNVLSTLAQDRVTREEKILKIRKFLDVRQIINWSNISIMKCNVRFSLHLLMMALVASYLSGISSTDYQSGWMRQVIYSARWVSTLSLYWTSSTQLTWELCHWKISICRSVTLQTMSSSDWYHYSSRSKQIWRILSIN